MSAALNISIAQAKGPRLYRRRDNGIWIIRDTVRGDRSTGTRDRREAERALALHLARSQRGRVT